MKKKKKSEPMEESRVTRVKRVSKVRYYLLNILLGLVILITAAVLFIIFFCQVEKVTVKGSVVNNEAVIQSYILDDQYSSNAVYDVVKNRIRPKKNIPFVASYKVSMKTLNHLVITVTEKERVGVIADAANGRYIYYDASGVVTELSELYLDGLLVVNGATLEDAVIGQKLPMDTTQRRSLLAIQKQLKQVGVEVSAVNFMEDGTINLSYQNIIINLGTTTNLAQKTKRLPYILPYLDGKSGTLHLEDWTEENTDIVFEENL
ncbi:MAG: hypothetical protein E7278_08010 [Lachnospiraceae bacterium]|nr:hypothetical protein [Lachnospiraceae bacterium]